jgi:hypothetical protein
MASAKSVFERMSMKGTVSLTEVPSLYSSRGRAGEV